jgi:hypothetical protein
MSWSNPVAADATRMSSARDKSYGRINSGRSRIAEQLAWIGLHPVSWASTCHEALVEYDDARVRQDALDMLSALGGLGVMQ